MNGVSPQLETAESTVIRPDVAHLVTEDDTPVDNIASEKQMRLLTEPLYTSWKPGRKFLAAANVGVFTNVNEPPVVPDVFLSMDVEPHQDWWAKEHRSYFIWEFGKVPEVVIEVVSNREGGETGRKLEKYARSGVRYYVIYDPNGFVQPSPLIAYQLGRRYERLRSPILEDVELQIVEWNGEYEGRQDVWIRWADLQGNLVPTGSEQRQRADGEKLRADALAERLRQLGVDPDTV